MDKDIKLIWSNAQDYHGVGNRFAQMAEELYNVCIAFDGDKL